MEAFQAEIMAILESEIEAFETFLGILQIENETLQSRQIDSLPELTALKTEQITYLNQLASQRCEALTIQGFTPDPQGMASWLYYYDFPDHTLSTLWRGTVELARQAKDLNDRNGLLIELKLTQTQNALSILQATSDQLNVYGKDGQTHVPAVEGAHRDFGQA